MKVILKEKELKAAIADYLMKDHINIPVRKMKILLRRRSNNTEDVGSVMIELKGK